MKKPKLSLLTAVLLVAPLAAQTPSHREGAPFRARVLTDMYFRDEEHRDGGGPLGSGTEASS